MNNPLEQIYYRIESVPQWVKSRETNIESPKALSGSPYYYLLVDYQDKVTDKEICSYSQSIQKINDASRIEEASLYLTELNKSNQTIVFHSLEIIRDGERINVLELDEISVIQRERSLESHITNNRLTVSLSINDLREGDIIDFQSTFIDTAGEHPLYGKYYYSSFWLQWGCPVLNQYVTVTNKSTSSILYTKSIGQGKEQNVVNKSIAIDENFEEHLIDITISKIDESAPHWVRPDYIQFTTQTSWENISSYLYNYYSESGAFKNSIDVNNIDLLELTDNQELNALKIIRFVQNKIRYKGENHGIYSHTPKSPDLTLKKRAGDCKDKSNLLISLLKKIDVEAFLVLVNTKHELILKDSNPSALHFDHMVVQVMINGKVFYFDPTIQKQSGDFEKSAQLDYGYGLKLSGVGDDLVKINYDYNKRVFTLRHEFDFTNLKDQAVLKIHRHLFFHRADNIRFYFDSNEDKKLQEEYLQWAKDDTNLELEVIKPITITSDDDIDNSFKTLEVYKICNIDVSLKERNIEFWSPFIGDFHIPKSDKLPVRIDLDGELAHTIIVKYARVAEIGATKEEIKNKNFEYLNTITNKGNSLVFVTVIKSHTNEVKVEDIEVYRVDVDDMRKRSVSVFTHKSSSFIKDTYFEWLMGIGFFMYFIYYIANKT